MPTDSLTALRNKVSDRLALVLEEHRDRFSGIGPEVADLFDVAGPLLARGKRLRAAFLAAGWRSFCGKPLSFSEIQAGAGLELFQLAALVHDDLMDGSVARRGLPAAHLQFRRLHDGRAMISDGEAFGAAGALLLGDLLLVAAQSELDAAVRRSEESAIARETVQEMMAEVTVGQYLDIYAQSAPWSADPTVDLDRAKRVIRAKSARYSVEHPLVIGAAMAGATREQRQGIRAVGLPIGEAFQLRDDLLSVFGDSDVTGKPTGDDFREGKRTVLVTVAMTLAPADEVELLKAAIGDPDLSDDQVDEVRRILTSSGAVEHVEELIAAKSQAASLAIDALELPEDRAALLRTVSSSAVTRDQ